MRTSALFSFVQTPRSLVMMRLLSGFCGFVTRRSFARLPADPLPDVTRAIPEFNTLALARGEKPHDRPVDKCRLGQVDDDPRPVPPQFRLNRAQVIPVDLPADPQRRGIAIKQDLDLHHWRKLGVVIGPLLARRQRAHPLRERQRVNTEALLL